MEKQIRISKEQNNQDKYLVAKVLDKIKLSQNRNKIEDTNFFDLREQQILQDILSKRKELNYVFYGGYKNAERKILLAYSNNIEITDKIYNQFLSIVRINLPSELIDMYEHKNYLGTLMNIGIKREKIGDIIVRNNGADILVKKYIAEYIINNLALLTRFKKSKIEIKNIEDLIYVESKKDILNINVPSMRLDCIVGELARCSRKDANNLLKEERIFVNFKLEVRSSKQLNEGDYITIRGKGRFKIKEIIGPTRNGRIALKIEK